MGRIAWLHAGSFHVAVRDKPDIWFGPTFVLPAWWRGPSVVTVQDLVFVLMRDRYRGTLNARYATAATRLSCRKASRVISPSRETSQDLTALLGVDPAKMSLIPNGISDVFFDAGTAEVAPLPEDDLPEFLFVGTFEARKGLDTLYEAMSKLNHPRPRARLVLAGKPGWGADDVVKALSREPWSQLVLEPTDRTLGELYRRARALVYPSRMEGFGLPVGEAMASSGNVIASDLGCIRDFAGSVPLYVSAGDSDCLAAGMDEFLNAPGEELEKRRVRGREQIAALRWARVGESVARTIEASLEARPST